MARIFSVLAVLAVLMLAANFAIGLWAGDFNAAAKAKREAQNRLTQVQRNLRAARQRTSPELEEAKAAYLAADAAFEQPRARMTLHMLFGAGGTLLAILVNSITITYFVGTSRWCKEVCETYRLPRALAEESVQLKRRTFPWTLLGILTLILVVGLGAAADPSGANWSQAELFVPWHYAAAMAALVIVSFSFWVQITRVAANYGVIERILAEVKRIRDAHSAAAAASGWQATGDDPAEGRKPTGDPA